MCERQVRYGTDIILYGVSTQLGVHGVGKVAMGQQCALIGLSTNPHAADKSYSPLGFPVVPYR